MAKAKPTAAEMKTLLMCYWRFQRQCYIVAQEFSRGDADIIAFSRKGRNIYETEVKISIADMRRDRNKPKHYGQGQFWGGDQRSIWANYFYFAVPENIKERALKVCLELFPYAGLLIVRDYEPYLRGNASPGVGGLPIDEIKEPKRHNVKPVNEETIFRLAKGMSNNLCTLSYELMKSKRGM